MDIEAAAPGWIAHAEESELAQFIEQLARKDMRFVDCRGVWNDSLIAEARERFLDLTLLWTEFKIHDRQSPVLNSCKKFCRCVPIVKLNAKEVTQKRRSRKNGGNEKGGGARNQT